MTPEPPAGVGGRPPVPMPPSRQHAYRTPLPPPQRPQPAPRRSGGSRWAAGSPDRARATRRLLWTVGIVAVVAILLGAHRITQTEVLLFCILVPSLILHEVSHGAVALAFGDDTARRAGRISLNPLRHVDAVGTLIVPAVTVLSGWGFFGWAKPVPVDVRRLRSPRNHSVVVALAGPLTNVLIAAVSGVVFYQLFVAGHTGFLQATLPVRIVFDIGVVNLWVAVFNMIPIPPLDGSALVERLLPASWWPGYLRVRPFGLVVVFGGILLLSMVHVYPLDAVIAHLLTWWAHLLHA